MVTDSPGRLRSSGAGAAEALQGDQEEEEAGEEQHEVIRGIAALRTTPLSFPHHCRHRRRLRPPFLVRRAAAAGRRPLVAISGSPPLSASPLLLYPRRDKVKSYDGRRRQLHKMKNKQRLLSCQYLCLPLPPRLSPQKWLGNWERGLVSCSCTRPSSSSSPLKWWLE